MSQPSSGPQLMRREQNAAIGDRLEERLDEFFFQFDENQTENEPSSTGNIIFLRNAIGSLSEVVGGENIMD
jgi:hypothetical protein